MGMQLVAVRIATISTVHKADVTRNAWRPFRERGIFGK